MRNSILLDMAMELGYGLAMCGAETYRVEESISRILAAYDITAEVFAIPNCLIVSTQSSDGETLSRMRRIGQHDSNIDGVERLSNLSRRICAEKPEPEIAMEWLKTAEQEKKTYSFWPCAFGGFLGALGFCLFFGGSLIDCFFSGICGALVFFVMYLTGKFHVNTFFSTISASFIMAVLAYSLTVAGIVENSGPVIIGALMSLVPGWLFTNGMRDIIFGDTNSGINRIVQVFLIAAALALGTGAAWNLISLYFTIPVVDQVIEYSDWIICIGAFIGCCGFLFAFDIHGWGGLLCAFGGMLTCGVLCVCRHIFQSEIAANFFAVFFAAVYSEIMARVRKYPAISYQVVSMFPLVPGAGIYYTTHFLVTGNIAAFSSKGAETIGITGVLAVGILLVSTFVRFTTQWKLRSKNRI